MKHRLVGFFSGSLKPGRGPLGTVFPYQKFACFCLLLGKTLPENWDSKAPSVGTLLAYLETTAYIIFLLGIKLFCFSRYKVEIFSICLKKNFVKPQKISTHSALSDNSYFHFLYQLSHWVEILWGFTKLFSKQMLKILAFLYLVKQKSFFPKKHRI